ncbi:hypothetical protein PQR79_12340, partial [Shewanella sp. ER-Te-42B-Light]|nr:hypothetical protein [Shewanella metallivivens]
MPRVIVAAFFFVILLSHTSASANDEPVDTSPAVSTVNKHDVDKVANIVIVSHPIFDESDPDAIFLHRWANYLHINTKESTILNSLSFEKGDKISKKDLEEAQRLLRYEPYIR